MRRQSRTASSCTTARCCSQVLLTQMFQLSETHKEHVLSNFSRDKHLLKHLFHDRQENTSHIGNFLKYIIHQRSLKQLQNACWSSKSGTRDLTEGRYRGRKVEEVWPSQKRKPQFPSFSCQILSEDLSRLQKDPHWSCAACNTFSPYCSPSSFRCPTPKSCILTLKCCVETVFLWTFEEQSDRPE